MIDVLGGGRGRGVIQGITAEIHRNDGSVEKRTLYSKSRPLLWLALAILVVALAVMLSRAV